MMVKENIRELRSPFFSPAGHLPHPPPDAPLLALSVPCSHLPPPMPTPHTSVAPSACSAGRSGLPRAPQRCEQTRSLGVM